MELVGHDLAIRNFKEVLGFDQSNTIILVNYLSNTKITVKNSSDRFTNWASSLKLVNFIPVTEGDPIKNNNIVTLKNANATAKNWDTFQTVGRGSFGRIYKGVKHSEQVYKFIKAPEGSTEDYLENFYRGIFLEAWIQTILSSDPIYGKNVAKVIKLKRANIANGVFIVMENIPLSSGALIDKIKNRDPNKLITLKGLIPVLKQIVNALDHFKKSYNFFHRDFHMANFMAADDESIKLIDFGLSCVRLNNNDGVPTIFSMPEQQQVVHNSLKQMMNSNDNSCASFDILMLITSMYDLLIPRKILDVETAIFLELLYLYMPNGGVIKFNMMAYVLTGIRTMIDQNAKKPYVDAIFAVNTQIFNLPADASPESKKLLFQKLARYTKAFSELQETRLFWTTYPLIINQYMTFFTGYGDPFVNFKTDNFKNICDDPAGFLKENEMYITNYLVGSVLEAQRKTNPKYAVALPNTIYLKIMDKNYKEPLPENEELKNSMPVKTPVPVDNGEPLEAVLSSVDLVPNNGKPRAVGWLGWAKGLMNRAKAVVKGTKKGGLRGKQQRKYTLKYL